MENQAFNRQMAKALKAGQARDYHKAVIILEDLAAGGSAEEHPEVYLYLARSWHAEKVYSRAVSCARSYINLRPGDGSGWFFLGRSWLSGGAYDRAIHAFRKSIELNPASLDARTLLGMACMKAHRPVLARSVFEEALSLAPEDPRINQGYLNALFVEAVRTYKRGEADTARQMLTFLINNGIDGVVPRLYLAHALRELGYHAESLGQYEAAIQFAPEDAALQWYPVAVLLDMGETARAAERMAELGSPAGDGELSEQMVSLRIIRNHLDQGEWANAAGAARGYLKTWGSDPQVHALMGEALRNLGKPDESLNHFKRALELDRKNPAPHYGIVLLLAGERNWKALAPELERAASDGCDGDTMRYYRVLCAANLDLDPEPVLSDLQEEVRRHGAVPELLLALARTYFRLGLVDLAAGWYRKVIKLEDDNEEAWLGYIASCEETGSSGGSGPSSELLGAYRGYLERWGDNLQILQECVTCLAANGLWEEAADRLEQLAGAVPSGQYGRQLALYRRKAGQYRQAAILYRDMLRRKSDDRALLANLVFCLDRMGQTAAALRLLREANRMFASDADSLLIEGRLELRLGNTDAALAVFRKIVDLWPKDSRGWSEIASVYTIKGVPEMAAMHAQKARAAESAARR